MDPATVLPTGHVAENALPEDALPRLAEIEMIEPDFNAFTDLAQGPTPAASLSAATRGDLEQSRRHSELRRPNGLGDELRAVLGAESGTWGCIVLMRQEGRPDFTGADVRLVASVARLLGEGLRRAILLSAQAAPNEPDDAVGLLLLADDGSVASTNVAARRWLAELGAGDPDGRLPFVVRTVANRARDVAAGDAGGPATVGARVPTASGHRLLVRGSTMRDGPDAPTAVLLEPARSPELAPLIAAAHDLTPREQAVTRLVARGLTTSAIARALHVSPYTVQDHLKSVFGKVGVRTRGELVARLFFEHYAPRLARGAPLASDGWFAPVAGAA